MPSTGATEREVDNPIRTTASAIGLSIAGPASGGRLWGPAAGPNTDRRYRHTAGAESLADQPAKAHGGIQRRARR